MADLSNTANLKDWLNLPQADSASDAILGRLITQFSAFFETQIGRTILSQSYTEVRSGVCGAVLVLRNYPVTAVASLVINGQAASPSADGFKNGFVFDEHKITFLQGSPILFYRGRSNIQVTYTAGYLTTPPDVEQAVLEMAGLHYRQRSWIGKNSDTMNGMNTSYSNRDVTPYAQSVIDFYSNKFPVVF